MAPVLHRTRASCAASRTAEELCGGAGTSSARRDAALPQEPPEARGSRTPGLSGPSARGGRFRSDRTGTQRVWWWHRPALGALLLTVVAAACGGDAVASSGTPDPALRLEDAQPTLESLGRHVLRSLVRQDTVALNRVRLTEAEHNDVVWPELPASAPEVNFPVDYAWTNIRNRNTRGMIRLLPMFANRAATFQRVECHGGVETFETFVVHTDCRVVFAVDQSPRLWEVHAFRDALERGGGFKVFRYYDEEPRRYRGFSLPPP